MKPEVYQYENYRNFLSDMYQHFKDTKRGFSHRAFAKKAGLKSFNYLKLVIDGERNLSPKMIPAFIKGLELNKAEGDFFEKLVYFNQSKSLEEKKRYYEALASSKRYRQIKEIEVSKYEYFSNWYHAAIRELAMRPDFKANPAWIAEQIQPSITEAQAKDSIELLQGLGFIQLDDQGGAKLTETNVASAPEVESLALMNFHRQMIERAQDSLEHDDADIRDISSITLSITEKEMEIIKKQILKFRRKILADFGTKANRKSRVYQMNVQMFPLSKGEGSHVE